MDTAGKIEAVLKSFNEKKKKDAEEKEKLSKKQDKKASTSHDFESNACSRMNSPVSLGRVAVLDTQDRMEEFDQFVLHQELKKQQAQLVGSGYCTTQSMVLNQTEEMVTKGKDMQQVNECILGNDVVDPTDAPSVEMVVHHESGTSRQIEETQLHNDIENMDIEKSQAHSDLEGIDVEKVLHLIEDNSVEDDEPLEAGSNSEEDENADEEYLFPTPDEINDARTPEIGMNFPTLEEAVRFINVYGKLNGFAVIKGRNYKHKKITLQCNRSRKIRSKFTEPRKRKRNIIPKTDCQMSVTVKLVETKWQITACSLQHNHDMVPSPSLTKNFLSHRTMTEEEKLLSRLLQEIRVKPQKIMIIFRRLKGSFGNITFGKKKMDNLKQAARKMKQNSDIACTLQYIEKIQLDKPGFCSKMQVDAEGAVRSIFWTDARSRLDYKLFGEIICFDTTYSTNKYNMPFAPIIGINGHAKTIVFGWALLKDQTSDTFEWLFKSFLEIMGGKKPRLILTDQDQGISSAVSIIFADAFHRFCIWHILKNMRENMCAYMSDKEGMEETIISLIMQSLHTTEFETGWKEMIETYNCGEHDHIKRMWALKEKYVPAYFKGSFCPFTRTTGRSESFNSNFKEYVMRKDTIETFLKQYELFQENVLEIENEDRFQSTQQTPVFWGRSPIERHAAQVYTCGIYLKFVTELLNSTAFGVTEIVRDRLYEVRKLFYYEKPEYIREVFTISVDRSAMQFECECSKFEKDGILCCHILRLFTQFDVIKIPQDYILDRWTIEYREKELLKHKEGVVAIHGSSTSENTLRYAMLVNCVNDVCVDISRFEDKSALFIEEVYKLHKRLMGGDDSLRKDDGTSVTLKDPPVIKKKSSKTKKSTEENAAPESTTTATGPSVNIWVNEDGSISRPVEEISKKQKSKKKIRNEDSGPNSDLKDPPVCSSKSVCKGKRLKPQSEKKSRKKKATN